MLLNGANGDVIRLDDAGVGFHIGADTVRLFGPPPVEVQRSVGAGAGSRYAGKRPAERPIDIRVTVQSATASEQRARLDRLSAALDVLGLLPTLPSITVVDPELGMDDARTISVAYVDGWDGATTVDTRRTFERVPLSLIAPDPYWYGARPVTIPVSTTPSVPLLSSTLPLLPLRIASSQVQGSLTLMNPGDVESSGVWTFTGPGGPIVAYPGTTAADGFRINTTMAAGQSLTLDTENGTLVDQAGADAYGLLDPFPQFWPLPPGVTPAVVSMTNATAASRITVSFVPRWTRAL